MYVTVSEYIKIAGISKQAVYKKIRSGKLKSKKDNDGITLVYVPNQVKPKEEAKAVNNIDADTEIKGLYQSNMKNLENENNALKEIIRLKDEKILQLEKENQELRQKKGFLDKIF